MTAHLKYFDPLINGNNNNKNNNNNNVTITAYGLEYKTFVESENISSSYRQEKLVKNLQTLAWQVHRLTVRTRRHIELISIRLESITGHLPTVDYEPANAVSGQVPTTQRGSA